MKLKDYMACEVQRFRRDAFAQKLGTSWAHLRNVAFGHRPCAPELAVAIELATKGVVHRTDIRPDDFWLIWPELTYLRKAA